MITTSFFVMGAVAVPSAFAAEPLFPALASYASARVGEFDQIPEERKAELRRVADYVRQQVDAQQPAQLLFVCTHNSRRSHMAQLFAAAASVHYGVQPVRSYSGGTETTAFNPRAVAAMKRAGFEIETQGQSENPRHQVRYAPTAEPMLAFSKIYDQAPNPSSDFAAIMVCSEADEQCPVVAGAKLRIGLPYEDPKASDGTAAEASTYDERARQIAREVFYLFSQV